MLKQSEMEGLDKHRRVLLTSSALLAAGAFWPGGSDAGDGRRQSGALREMQIHRVPELGLEIWVENQPPWRAELRRGPHLEFTAEAPEAHHPPAVMSYASWPRERVADEVFATLAKTAIARASQNFGVSVAASRAIVPKAARYGVLAGYEADFAGKMQDTAMDVKIFVGQEPGRFPIALTVYTLRGKINHLDQHARRAWSKLAYL